MRKVYGIGETICDIIFKDNQPQAAKAGGSTFNAMVSLGRMGVTTSFISKIGDDKMGRIILDFMIQNHISTENMTIWNGHKTDISLAFLNEKGDAEYSFYKEYDKQFVEAHIPAFKKDDVLLFGSYFALNPLLRPLITKVIEAAQAAQAIIYYDPNFRSSHAHEVEVLRPLIFDNMKAATVVRGSDEDFDNVYSEENDYSTELFALAPQLIITRNAAGVDVMDNGCRWHFPAKTIVPVSTIGAGDSFNAGFIYALLQYGVGFDDFSQMNEELWGKLVKTAVSFSTAVCQSYDNYIPVDFDCKAVI